MSHGDEIMAAGQAAALWRTTGRRVRIVDRRGGARWDPLWEHNPAIARPDERGDFDVLLNASGARPYIDYTQGFDRTHGVRFTRWQASAEPGRIHLTVEEARLGWRLREELGRPFVVIEPNLAPEANPNKQWGRWQDLVDALPGVTFVQFAWGAPLLRGVVGLSTTSFRQAICHFTGAEAYVGPEGGLHHAAGAMGLPAVVIFGGHTSPSTTGYPWHTNLYPRHEDSPCGQWSDCQHCQSVMAGITPREVAQALRHILRAHHAASPDHAARRGAYARRGVGTPPSGAGGLAAGHAGG